MTDDAERRDLSGVRAETKIDLHMTDCKQFRVDLLQTLAEFREDIKKLNWRMAVIVGIGVMLSKGIDILSIFSHHGVASPLN